MNTRNLRRMLWVGCAVQVLFAAAFIFQVPFVVRLWPLPYTNPTSFMFIASIFAAAAASTIWCLVTGEDGALAGVALDYITIFTPTAIFAFQIARNQAMNLFGIACVMTLLVGIALLLWARRIPFKNILPMPRIIRYSFIVFIVALLIVGGALVLKTRNILPWSVSPEASVMYGWFFIGAAAYFAYGVLRPAWANTGGQLAGFLAYDLVLILPFLANLATIRSELRLSLIIYIAVLVYSGALAGYYLFIHPQTRLFPRTARLAANRA